MSYTPTRWENGKAPAINADNLNKIENELVKLDTFVEELKEDSNDFINDVAFDSNSGVVTFTTYEGEEKEVDVSEYVKRETSIKNVATGENIHIADSKDDNVIELEVYGKSTQGENPSPEYPQEVISSVANEIKTQGKNFIPYPYFEASHVDNGITWTDLGNGKVMANGTATANSAYFLQRYYDGLVEGESYTLTGCPKNGGTDSWLLRVADDSNTNNIMASDYGDGRTFTYTKDSGEVRIYLRITAGVTVNNLIFEPMLRLAEDSDATWEPYKESVVTLSQPIELNRIEVTANDDYTYSEDGKYYVADTIEKIDGEYKKVERIAKRLFDGVNNVCKYVVSVKGATEQLIQMNLNNGDALFIDSTRIMCDRFKVVQYSATNLIAYTCRQGSNGSCCCYLRENDGVTDVATANEWLKANPVTVYYILAEPITTSLPSEVAELDNLLTFYPITNVSNNANAEMKVKYYADTKNYIDGKIATLEMALVNNI